MIDPFMEDNRGSHAADDRTMIAGQAAVADQAECRLACPETVDDEFQYPGDQPRQEGRHHVDWNAHAAGPATRSISAPIRVVNACCTAAEERGATMAPMPVASTGWRTPGRSLAITGIPRIIASTCTIPKASNGLMDGRAKMSSDA